MTIPPPLYGTGCLQQRMNLPIYPYRYEILNKVTNNQVVLIQSSTGSGKSTQIPQYIMEEATEFNRSCRIICAQPRRLSAVSIAERVAYERNEEIGKTVGYQIRLESKVSPNSNLIYCTNGVLLRCLMSGDPADFFNKATHLIIDEVHQRCKFTDFLLIAIKIHAKNYPHLKIIIMSATLETRVFSQYFDGCPEMRIPGNLYQVTEYFLEDILKITNFKNDKVDALCSSLNQMNLIVPDDDSQINKDKLTVGGDLFSNETNSCLDDLLAKMHFLDHPDNEFCQFFLMVQSNDIPVDFRQSDTNLTALMIAAGRDYFDHVKTLLDLKANPELTIVQDKMELNCYDIAMDQKNSAVAQLINDHMKDPSRKSTQSTFHQKLLEIYFNSCKHVHEGNDRNPEDKIDIDLILNLICEIHYKKDKNGAIMVFLAGYDDILQLANLINSKLSSDYELFLLHSNMCVQDQKVVFLPIDSNKRKIILTTNIAETSITIPEVCYVLDSGKEKQKCYDYVMQCSMLRSQWISKAVAKQRKGRAGRLQNGIVYRFYSRERYNFMLENTTPEIVRTDLTEICLQTKLLEKEIPIEEYLLQAITPPQTSAIRRSIKLLYRLGALDDDENLTTLGFHLADIPVDVKLSKMLIYGIIFKCIDPILTLVSCLSMQDPFVILHDPADRKKLQELKQKLDEKSFSDHLVLLRIFQLWNNFKTEDSNDREFCEEHFINVGTLERINGTRSKIIGHLRSLGLIKSNGNLTLMNTHSTKWSVIKLCLAAGLYPSIAKIDQKTGTITSERERKLVIHSTSSLNGALNQNSSYPTEWAIYEEQFKVGKLSIIKGCSMVTGLTIAFTAGKQLTIDTNNSCILQVDDWIRFITTENNVHLVCEMRRLLDELMNKYLKDVHDYKFTDQDGYLIDAIATIIQMEDELNGFTSQHSGIGARPRAITLKCSAYENRRAAGTSGRKQDEYLSRKKQLNCVSQTEQVNGLPLVHQPEKVREVPVMKSKLFIMVKVTVTLFKNIFGNRFVADAREFNFPTSFFEHIVKSQTVEPIKDTYIIFCSAMPPQVMVSEVSVENILSLTISTQRSTFITWDKSNGKPFHNLITWSDTRANEFVERWNKSLMAKTIRIGASALHFITHKNKFKQGSSFKLTNNFVTPKLNWMINNNIKLKRSIIEGKALFGTLDSWLLYKLRMSPNSEKHPEHISDMTNASATGFYDPFEQAYAPWMLKEFGFDESMLPQVVDNSYDFGYTAPTLFGLPIKILMIADQSASLIGNGCFRNMEAKITLGTGSFLNINTGTKCRGLKSGGYPLVGWSFRTPGKIPKIAFFLEKGFNETGVLIRFAQIVGLCSDPKELSDMASSVQDCDGVTFVPKFSNNGVTGFTGFKSSTTKEHLVRAVLESVVFTVADLFFSLKEESNFASDKIRVDGGISLNDFICQHLSDLINLKLERSAHCDELTSYGCAYMAAFKCGLLDKLEDSAKYYKFGKVFIPNEGNRKQLYMRYRIFNDLLMKK
ncbi:unnamed protein product [Diamesa tonsa]